MSEQAPGEAAARGDRAAAALDELRAAFAQVRSDYARAWAATTPGEAALREHYWAAMQVIDKVETQLRTIAGNGRVAARELERAAHACEQPMRTR